MNKIFKEGADRESHLIKSIWFMRIASILLALTLLAVIVAFGITTTATALFTLAIISLVLGLGYGIGYLSAPVNVHEMAGETNG